MGVGIVVPDPYPFAFRTRGGEVDIVRQINECAVGTHSFDLIPKQVLDRVVKQYFRFFDHQQFVGTGTEYGAYQVEDDLFAVAHSAGRIRIAVAAGGSQFNKAGLPDQAVMREHFLPDGLYAVYFGNGRFQVRGQLAGFLIGYRRLKFFALQVED